MKKSVYLSPSTQEHNRGYGGYGTEEERMNEVADVTQQALERHGVTVCRNKPEWTLEQIVADSNAKRTKIHLAIHSNAGGGRGCEAYCHRFGGDGEKLARAVYEELSPLTPTGDRGVKEGYNFFGPGKHIYELAKTNAPAALVEVAFHDDPDDAAWILENIEPIGQAIGQGILKFLGLSLPAGSMSLQAAVDLLRTKGIMQNPDYWLENAEAGKIVQGEYAAILIQRVAAILMKGGI